MSASALRDLHEWPRAHGHVVVSRRAPAELQRQERLIPARPPRLEGRRSAQGSERANTALVNAAAEGIDLDQWRSADSTSGFRGVYRRGSGYQALIRIKGKGNKYLGAYATLEEAALAHAKEHIFLIYDTEEFVLTDDGFPDRIELNALDRLEGGSVIEQRLTEWRCTPKLVD